MLPVTVNVRMSLATPRAPPLLLARCPRRPAEPCALRAVLAATASPGPPNRLDAQLANPFLDAVVSRVPHAAVGLLTESLIGTILVRRE